MARIKIHGRGAVYHCISRIVGGQKLLGDLEKERLRLMLWQQAEFSGIQIITYALMSNHIHVLVRVPASIEATDTELVSRAAQFYGSGSLYVDTLQQAMAASNSLPEDLRTDLLGRMGDVSSYMKELKQRFSRWFNKQHNRFGTLWAERFKSILVEDQPSAIQPVAAYIDLNSVRAGLSNDPKDYRWCGYAEAVAGNERAQKGLAGFHEKGDWSSLGPAYRKVLMTTAGRAGQSGKVALDAEAIRQELAKGGELSLGEVLRLRVRYFSDGVVLGSRNYVNEVFREFRDHFGARRKTGARPMRGLKALEHLATLRDLRVKAVG
jgi:REP element-mobilizing transposase RayT